MTRNNDTKRVFALDLVRAFAITIVLVNHGLATDIGIWQTIMRIAFFPSIVLFFMLSGSLLLPVEGSYKAFLKKRLVKVLVPFVIWSAIYALLHWIFDGGDLHLFVHQVKWCLLKPTFNEGWFVLVMCSLYLFMPILSPWIKSASRRELEYFIVIWLGAGMCPYLAWMIFMYGELSVFCCFITLLGYPIVGYYLLHYPVRCNLRQYGIEQHDSKRWYAPAVIGGAFVMGVVAPLVMLFCNTPFDVADMAYNDYCITSMAWGIMAFALLISVNSLGRVGNAIVRTLSKNAFGMYLAYTAIRIYIINAHMPKIADTTWRMPVLFAMSYVVAVALKRIPVVGKYMV